METAVRKNKAPTMSRLLAPAVVQALTIAMDMLTEGLNSTNICPIVRTPSLAKRAMLSLEVTLQDSVVYGSFND